jgi:serine/threonine protein kinase
MIIGSFPFYLAQLMDMMSILDAHEVFHGGLNFNNVRIRENGYLKLAGFENSFKPDKTKRKMIYTKSPWPAPELMLFGSTTAASNWYSLGAFVYELLTNKSFIPSDVFDRQDLDSDLRMIIGDLSCKDSHRRYLRTLRLKQMDYFKDIDWEKLRSGELKAPISFLFNE